MSVSFLVISDRNLIFWEKNVEFFTSVGKKSCSIQALPVLKDSTLRWINTIKAHTLISAKLKVILVRIFILLDKFSDFYDDCKFADNFY